MNVTKVNVLALLLTLSICTLNAQNKADRESIKQKNNTKKLNQLQKKYNDNYLKMVSEAKKLKLSLDTISLKEGTKTLAGIKNGIPFYDEDDNENAAITGRVDKIWDGGTSGLNLTGNGIIIGHWEASGVALTTHVELINNIVALEFGVSAHATHTAGTMIAKGIDASARGMASGATIHARKSDNDESEMAAFASNGGLISNHSYSSNNPNGNNLYYGYYSDLTAEWDDIAYNAPYYLIVKSAGNVRNDGVNVGDGGYDVLYSQSVAKNALVVGAINDVANYTGPGSISQTDFSSYGPTDDWRIKPDIVANGRAVYSCDDDNNTDYRSRSGSSMAAPAVTGAVALLQEHYNNLNSAFMKSATVKALLVNTADESGTNPGPDFANGWGLINAEAAANVISNNTKTALMLEETLNNSQTFLFTITVDGTTPLALAIAWADPAATPLPEGSLTEDQSDIRLINDLDVRITGNGQTYFPWIIETGSFTNPATTGDNFRDNVEKIDVPSLTAGTYTVSVTHKGTLSDIVNGQEFSLVANGIASYSLGTEDKHSLNQEIMVYPNPNKGDMLFVKFRNNNASISNIQLFDVIGKQQIKTPNYDAHNKTIDVSSLKSGIYILKVKTDLGTINKKIVIK